MNVEQLKEYTKHTTFLTKKIIKPWKKNMAGLDWGSDEYAYALGWNKCLESMEANWQRFKKYQDEFYETIPTR